MTVFDHLKPSTFPAERLWIMPEDDLEQVTTRIVLAFPDYMALVE